MNSALWSFGHVNEYEGGVFVQGGELGVGGTRCARDGRYAF